MADYSVFGFVSQAKSLFLTSEKDKGELGWQKITVILMQA